MTILITTVVVTFNRRNLLERCLSAIARQTQAPDSVLVVDNASTDGTREWLRQWLPTNLPQGKLITLEDNLGGAGGFAAGIEAAMKDDRSWIWMMDDDAEPHPDALEELMQVACSKSNIYGSLATFGNETSWPMTVLSSPSSTTCFAGDIPAQARVQMLPFLGFLIHHDLVEKIGLPDAGFFIAADDVEYCVRAQKFGAQTIVAGRSHIEHPKSRPYEFRLIGLKLTCIELPPWKRYYDTRNRLLIARKHYGAKLFTQTIPGSFVRMVATLAKEPRKLAQLKAFAAGFSDGLLGRKGRRHQKWGIGE